MTPSSDETPPIPHADDTPSDSTTPTPVTPQDARRRRLLKGLIGIGTAVPVIFTLQRSGRATAFFGSNQACLNNMDDATTVDEACQALSDDKVRINRSLFFDDMGSGNTCDRTTMTGGASVGTDQCLVYYHPDSGWFDYANSCSNSYGKATGYKVMTYTCWTSLHNTPGSTSGISGAPQ
ncbi:MAG: hypothetical protein HQL86_08560 [Magnetococcales bacterium]|nr:hypothetical protein [Magnetococcales bacterium]